MPTPVSGGGGSIGHGSASVRLWQYQARADVYPPAKPSLQSWSAVAPDSVKRRRSDFGSDNLPLLALTQPTAPGAGFDGVSPDCVLRRKSPVGEDFTPPVGRPIIPGTGTWEAAAPHQFFRARPADPGASTFILLALPQPVAPGAGFEGVSPDRALLRRWVRGAEVPPYNLPPAPPDTPPFGWVATFPWASARVAAAMLRLWRSSDSTFPDAPQVPDIRTRPPLLSRGDSSVSMRLRRDHELLADIINSLLTSGQLVRIAPGVWKIVPK